MITKSESLIKSENRRGSRIQPYGKPTGFGYEKIANHYISNLKTLKFSSVKKEIKGTTSGSVKITAIVRRMCFQTDGKYKRKP